MNWTEKFWDFRAEALVELGRVLQKGYDMRDAWQKSYEDGTEFIYELPTCTYIDDGLCTIYSLVYFDGKSFLGYSWDDSEEFWFSLDDLDTITICNLIDLINEPD